MLSGAVVAPGVPARRSGGCQPGRTTRGCYVWASAAGPLRFSVVREPAHGVVALAPGADGLHAGATYTPAAGFSGEDSFTYVATDARGLTSKPATARVTVPAGPGGGAGRGARAGSALEGARGQAARALARRAAGERAGAPVGAARAAA